MDTNDFLGSWADENVSFTVQTIRTASVGQNMWTTMIFVENSRYVDSTEVSWENAPNLEGVKVLTVTSSTYAKYTKGLLQSWLYDLFATGATTQCILVACAPDIPEDDAQDDASGGQYSGRDAVIEGMTKAYHALKAYAYFKTSCVGADQTNPDVAVALAKLCATDKKLLSAAPLYPCVSLTPDTDPIYQAMKTDAMADAFMSYHEDTSHNGALYSLGLALAAVNSSKTRVGNGFDGTASQSISPSGAAGTNLGDLASSLKVANIQYFKTIGDNSMSVAAEGAKTINGEVYAADWIVAYITYMSKVGIARLITQRNFLRSGNNYSKIIGVLNGYINAFTGEDGRLKDKSITAPSFAELPESNGETLIIPNAWSATYVDNVRKVEVSGNLYIGG